MARALRENWNRGRREKNRSRGSRGNYWCSPNRRPADGHSQHWIATLDGVVLSETMKQMAERDAWYMLEVKGVVNRVRVER